MSHVNRLVKFLENPDNVKDRNGNTPDDPGYDPRYLKVPPGMLAEMRPFDKQFWTIKKDHFDTLLFFKCGSFYELYDRDADVAVKELDMKYRLNQTCAMRTCGFPEKSVNHYAALLIGRGHKVGRVEEFKKQEGDKTVPRKLCQVLTLATLTDLDMLMDDTPNYIISIKEDGFGFGVCLGDLARASFRYARLSDELDLATILHAAQPRELVIERASLSRRATAVIASELPSGVRRTLLTPDVEFLTADAAKAHLQEQRYFGDAVPPKCLESAWEDAAVMSAIGAMAWHLQDIKMADQLLPLQNFAPYDPTESGTCLSLDATTLGNLDIVEPTARGGRTILQHVGHCVTAFGRRRLRQWLCSPLSSAVRIRERQEAVAELVEHPEKRHELRSGLRGFPDLERFLGRLGTAGREPEVQWIKAQQQNARLIDLFKRTLAGLRKSLDLVGGVKSIFDSALLKGLCTMGQDGSFPDIREQLERSCSGFEITDDDGVPDSCMKPLPGSHKEFDEKQAKLGAVQARLDAHLQEVKAYYGKGDARRSHAQWWHHGKEHFVVEVPKRETQGMKPMAGLSEFNKSTQQVARFHSARCRDDIALYLRLKEERNRLLRGFLKERLREFSESGRQWRSAVACLATLDCLCSLAEASSLPGMCKPTILDDGPGAPPLLTFRGLVHPLACPAVGSKADSVVPNDLSLGENTAPSVALITGPNMGGKSTLMRAVCIATILAQLGCFVPADSATLVPVDRIFTRIGANDRILSGHSTFMIEMKETSEMLRFATKNSLLVLDELGRGTATHDGYAIAHAVLYDIVTRLRCRCLFSTHYHQLCKDVEQWSVGFNVAMHHMRYEIDPATRAVSFLYRLGPGSSVSSYGVDVARKAGLPAEVIDSARRKSEDCRSASACQEQPVFRVAARAMAALGSSDSAGLADLGRLIAASLGTNEGSPAAKRARQEAVETDHRGQPEEDAGQPPRARRRLEADGQTPGDVCKSLAPMLASESP